MFVYQEKENGEITQYNKWGRWDGSRLSTLSHVTPRIGTNNYATSCRKKNDVERVDKKEKNIF